ncbi:UNKNOWN [Stylonychia lemnae]|uniref:Uncharacterized protein n=1 Tax=Stylonychia lemnae TaxID=5949 RepID=A0A078AD30_STYLE|nr:UNKNOWN [Stylonychia lemnae]|eukprot:CDW80150.1 UNKNOWN [Stylonychia lemnae]
MKQHNSINHHQSSISTKQSLQSHSPSKNSINSLKSQTVSSRTKAKPNIRDKLSNLESNLETLRKDIDHQEAQMIDKRQKETITLEKDLTRQITKLKDGLSKLTDVIVEEFEQVRYEARNDIQKTEWEFLKRMESIEIKQQRMLQDQTSEDLLMKQRVEQQHQYVINFENHIRREQDRQKMLQSSLLTDTQYSCKQLTEDVQNVFKQIKSLQQNIRIKDEILESLKNQQDLSFKKQDDLEANFNQFVEIQTENTFKLDQKLERAVKDLDILKSKIYTTHEQNFDSMIKKLNFIEYLKLTLILKQAFDFYNFDRELFRIQRDLVRIAQYRLQESQKEGYLKIKLLFSRLMIKITCKNKYSMISGKIQLKI